jgi:hypothetical protein
MALVTCKFQLKSFYHGGCTELTELLQEPVKLAMALDDVCLLLRRIYP